MKKQNKENQSKRPVKDTTNKWKCKARKRQKTIKRLTQRVRELELSRDKWRSKALSKGSSPVLSAVKASGHQYPLQMILLVLYFQVYGRMSLRSCRHCIGRMFFVLGLSCRVPSHSSIRNWICKQGYFRLREAEERTGSYVVYVDESISFGSEKILLILGTREDKLPSQRAIRHGDVEVLYVGIGREWKSEDIASALGKVGGNKHVSYVISDQGTNIGKACKSSQHVQIYDCTHRFANYLKDIHDKTPQFEAFCKLIGTLRKSWNLSKKYSDHMPPAMRHKMRFANIFPCVDWALRCLASWENFDEKQRECLLWLKDNDAFVKALKHQGDIFKAVCKTLKTKGFSEAQKTELVQHLKTWDAEYAQEEGSVRLIKHVLQYLDELSEKIKVLDRQMILCSSDIIESVFGRFKQKISPNSRNGLTEFIFTIANFSENFCMDEIKKALESVKLDDLAQLKNGIELPNKKTKKQDEK